MNIFSSIAQFSTKTLSAAKACVVLARNAYAELPGAVQHSKAVEMLVASFPSMAKWAAHALIGLAFGWIEKHTPEKLLPAVGTIKDDIVTAADAAADQVRLTTAPLTSAPAPAPVPASSTAPANVLPIAGLGESSPPVAATLL